MPTLTSARLYFDLGIKCDEADLADNDVVVVGAVCPVNGVVKEVWVGASTLPTAGTVAVANGATNLLGAANVNLATGITVGVGKSIALASGNSALKVTAGNILKATWTLTDITVSDDAVHSCIVVVEPETW